TTAPACDILDFTLRPAIAITTASAAQPISTDIPSNATGTARISSAEAHAAYAGARELVSLRALSRRASEAKAQAAERPTSDPARMKGDASLKTVRIVAVSPAITRVMKIAPPCVALPDCSGWRSA